MRENRPSGSEGGATVIPSSLPLSINRSLRDNKPLVPVRLFDSTPNRTFEDEDEDDDEDDWRLAPPSRRPDQDTRQKH
jgi:hypothetical protein